jgi:tRNA threonylcarbamoyladenosine biosynthesis protein TsaB
MILAIKTDNPIAEFYLIDNEKLVDEIIWQADRKLADNINLKISELLNRNNLELNDIKGFIIFKGPGSFTGLRISISVFNTMAYSLRIPIVGETGDNWLKKGLDRLHKGSNDKLILPEYGGEPNISVPKK